MKAPTQQICSLGCLLKGCGGAAILRQFRLKLRATAETRYRSGRPGKSFSRLEDGRRAERSGIQHFCLRPCGNQPRRHDHSRDRANPSSCEIVPGPLLRQQLQKSRSPAPAHLARGQANKFKKDMQSGIEFLRRRIPQVFEGEPFQRQKGRIVDRFTVREKELMDDFTRRIARDQFALGHMQVGAVALPENFSRSRGPDGAH